LPTHEEMKAQDMHNNCVIRSVLSGVMGNVTDELKLNLFCSVTAST
jgi:hypothetical protein